MLATVTGNIKNITGVLSGQGTVVFSLANFGKSSVNLMETNSPIGLTNSTPLSGISTAIVLSWMSIKWKWS